MRRYLPAALAFALGSLVWVFVVGSEISWDLINHHLYLPYSWVTGRHQVDLYAAGPQSYQNPLGFMPLFGMVAARWPAWAVGAVLTLLHAAAIVPLHRLALLLWGRGDDQRWPRIAALCLAWMSPVFLVTLGTSSVDPYSNALVLVALALMAAPKAPLVSVIAAGAAMGLSFAIKPVNAVFVLALAAFVALRFLAGQMSVRNLLILAASAAASALLSMGAWSMWLWQAYGNPLFPLFNHWFQSEFAPTQAMVANRFIPSSPWGYVTRPFEAALLSSHVLTEVPSPDLRLPALVLAAAAACVAGLARGGAAVAFRRSTWQRLDVQLGVYSVVAYLLWMSTSGNGRYALPLLSLAGVLLVRCTFLVMNQRWSRVSLGTLALLHVAYFVHDGQHRLNAVPWTGAELVEHQVPPRLANEPYLHLSLGMQSYSAMALWMHPGGAMANVVGQVSLPATGPLGDRLNQLISQWKGRTRVLYADDSLDGGTNPSAAQSAGFDRLLYRFNLQIDFSDCERLTLVVAPKATSAPMALKSCAVRYRQAPDLELERQLARAEAVFSHLEAQCPTIFTPVPMASDSNRAGWQRRYVNTEARIVVSETEGVMIDTYRVMKHFNLGPITDVIAGRAPNACELWKKLSND